MSWRAWRRHFEQSAARPLPRCGGEEVPTELRAPLARCLARFQLGESGGQRIVGQIERERLCGSDADHRAALQLFVREEARHADILAALVQSLGGRLLRHGWTRAAFALGRNCFGLRSKLLVLNVAEVIGIACYRSLCQRLPPGPTRDALAQLAEDEAQHLAFHAELFAQQRRHAWLDRALWWTVGLAACPAVLIDHGAALSALGVPRRGLLEEMFALLSEGGRRMAATPAAPALGWGS
jgi:hypothetical protein